MTDVLHVNSLMKVYGSYEFNSQDKISIAIARKTDSVSNISLLANGSVVTIWNDSSTDSSYNYYSPSGTVGYGLDIAGDRNGSVNYIITCISAAPTLTGIDPPSGNGGEVTLTGTGFYGTTGVNFDKTLATSFEIISDTKIIAAVPPDMAAGSPQTVTVTTDAGTTTATSVTYTLDSPPLQSAALTPTSSQQSPGESGEESIQSDTPPPERTVDAADDNGEP